MTRTLSIAIKENTYQELKQKIGVGKISSFVNQAVEKELSELALEEKKAKKKLRQQLIAAYQRIAKNKKSKKELAVWDETVDDYINRKQWVKNRSKGKFG